MDILSLFKKLIIFDLRKKSQFFQQQNGHLSQFVIMVMYHARLNECDLLFICLQYYYA